MKPISKIPERAKTDNLQNAEWQEFWILFHQTYQFIRHVRENELKGSDITFTQRHLLNGLSSLGGKATINELVMRHHSDYHNVAALVKRMAETELINRAQSAHGERQIVIELTEKGKRLLESTMNSEAIKSIISVLSKKDLDRIMSLFIKLRESSVQRLVEQETSRRFEL